MILFIIALILCAIGLALIACGRFFPEPVAAASVDVCGNSSTPVIVGAK